MKNINHLNCILLVDDDDATNFVHRMVFEQAQIDPHIQIAKNGLEALEYLKSAEASARPRPDVIFLDINMPKMNGWEFMEAYKSLPEALKANIIIIMLTTSLNPDDQAKAHQTGELVDLIHKPLSAQALKGIIDEHFNIGPVAEPAYQPNLLNTPLD